MEQNKNPVVVRVLPPEEYPLLLTTDLWGKMLKGFPDPNHNIIVVAQDEVTKKIVGYWTIFDAIHIEPLWVDEPYRKRTGVVRRLWETVRSVLIEKGIQIAFGVIHNNDTAMNLPMAMRLGFTKLPGDLFYIVTDPKTFGVSRARVEELVKQAVGEDTQEAVRH